MTRRTPLLACYRCRWLLIVVLVAALCPLAWADPLTPGPGDRYTTLAVAGLLRQHLTRHPLDKEISERCLKEFLKRLDLMKVYFYQSDVDEFMKQKDELCDAIRRGDVNFAYKVFHTFLERVDERIKTVDALLPTAQDFTVDEQIVKEHDKAQYPRNAAEARDLWRKRIKYDLLALKADKKIEGKKAQDKLAQKYSSFARRMHQIDSEELLEMYLDAFTSSFDPHTSYMSPESEENFDIAMSLELKGGIGASLVSEDGFTVVKKLVPGGVAAKERSTEDRRQDHRRRPRRRWCDGRRHRHETRQGRQAHSWQAGHGRPFGRHARQRHAAKDRQDRPPEDRVEGQRGQRGDFRRRPQGRRHALSRGRDRLAQLLSGHGRRSRRVAQFPQHDPRRAHHPRRLQPQARRRGDPRPPLQWRRVAPRSHQPHRPVHRRGAGGAGERPRGPRAALGRHGDGHGLVGPAGGADQQVQRQRQRDLRRGHPGLRPRTDRRRPLDPRQGDRPKPHGPGPNSCCICPAPWAP